MEALILGMAEAGVQGDDDDIFVYMGGDQEVPDGVRRARIHKSVKIIRSRAFRNRRQLISVEFHDGVEIIEEYAFYGCDSLKSIKLLGVRIIKELAFGYTGLTDVEFGDQLETIEQQAFYECTGLTKIKMPSVRTVGQLAFGWCSELSNLEFGEGLRTLQEVAFSNCHKLERIVLPLKDDMIENNVFDNCPKLETVDLVGGIHNIVASLHMESWRIKMNNEIYRINQVLPTITNTREKTIKIQQWMRSTTERLDHYKDEHHQLLKEATTLLELALWKAKLGDNEGGNEVLQRQREREQMRVTSGASIVIKNVLPFLSLES